MLWLLCHLVRVGAVAAGSGVHPHSVVRGHLGVSLVDTFGELVVPQQDALQFFRLRFQCGKIFTKG